ncbi:hypothetical protein JIQ42_01612 [Leishmania sp. Namibia]|uniref:hypothetical protein n=1 Tax=Leishmania sp. Namibia TaxID=2802991 RepID=UPI001B4F60F7|nr:hypothetical protein JIQ42_01612 [Leishmania sp. Namibia]
MRGVRAPLLSPRFLCSGALDGSGAGAPAPTAASRLPASAVTAPRTSVIGVAPAVHSFPARGVAVNGFFERSAGAAVVAVAGGVVKARVSGTVYAVHLRRLSLSPLVEVGSRVYLERGSDEDGVGVVMGGVAVRVNGNGTYGVLLDDDGFDAAVPAERVVLSEGRAELVVDAEYRAVAEWVRGAGVVRRAQRESVACVLFQRGWRVDRLYLLTAPDVHCATQVARAVRMCVLEKSEWQRDHHREMRQLLRERVKERDFRYKLAKYSGVVSASMALLGMAIAFGWNLKNYHTQQRAYELAVAARALTQALSGSGSCSPVARSEMRCIVPRDGEEEAVRQVLRRLDTAHPRIMVLTGFCGCGKSTVCGGALRRERVPGVHVDVRGCVPRCSSCAPSRTTKGSTAAQTRRRCAVLCWRTLYCTAP